MLSISGSQAQAQEVENLSYESGQNWISWTWDLNNTDFVYVYQDGVYVTQSELGNYTISSNPNEKHILTLIPNNSSNNYNSEAFSKKQSFEGNLIYLFLIAVLFLVLGLRFPLFSILAIPLFFYGGMIALNQSNESWIILLYFLSGAFSVWEFSLSLR